MIQRGCVGRVFTDDGTVCLTFLVAGIDDKGHLNGTVFLEERGGKILDREPWAIGNIDPSRVDDVTAEYLIKNQHSTLSWKPWKSIEVDIDCIVGRGTEKDMKEVFKDTYEECTKMMRLSYDLSKPIGENVKIGSNIYSNKLLLQIAEEIYCRRILKRNTEKLVPLETGYKNVVNLNVRYCEKEWAPILIEGMEYLYALAARYKEGDDE
jgi:hypothetical protein